MEIMSTIGKSIYMYEQNDTIFSFVAPSNVSKNTSFCKSVECCVPVHDKSMLLPLVMHVPAVTSLGLSSSTASAGGKST